MSEPSQASQGRGDQLPPPSKDSPLVTLVVDKPQPKNRREHHLNHIVGTEEKYQSGLIGLYNVYLPTLKTLDPSYEQFFSGLGVVLSVSMQFLRKLQASLEGFPDCADMPGVFRQYAPFFKGMSDCILNYKKNEKRIRHLIKSDSKFRKACGDCQLDPRTGGLDICSLMITPLQQLTRYPLLLRDLRDYTDKESPMWAEINSVYEICNKSATEVNALVDSLDKQLHVESLQTDIRGCPALSDHSSGKFVMEGYLLKICRKEPQIRFLVLFTKSVLIARPSKTGAGLDYHTLIPLEGCVARDLSGQLADNDQQLTEIAKPSYEELCQYVRDYMQTLLDKPEIGEMKLSTGSVFVLQTPQKSMCLVAESEYRRGVWMEALNKVIDSCDTNSPEQSSKKELCPVWIPDQLSDKCMNCGKPFSMTRRRHHCRACGRIICAGCLGTGPDQTKFCESCMADRGLIAVQTPVDQSCSEGVPLSARPSVSGSLFSGHRGSVPARPSQVQSHLQSSKTLPPPPPAPPVPVPPKRAMAPRVPPPPQKPSGPKPEIVPLVDIPNVDSVPSSPAADPLRVSQMKRDSALSRTRAASSLAAHSQLADSESSYSSKPAGPRSQERVTASSLAASQASQTVKPSFFASSRPPAKTAVPSSAPASTEKPEWLVMVEQRRSRLQQQQDCTE